MEFWVDTSAAFSPGCKVYCQLPELDSVSPVSVRIPSSYFGPDEAENWYIKKEVPVEISYFDETLLGSVSFRALIAAKTEEFFAKADDVLNDLEKRIERVRSCL